MLMVYVANLLHIKAKVFFNMEQGKIYSQQVRKLSEIKVSAFSFKTVNTNVSVKINIRQSATVG